MSSQAVLIALTSGSRNTDVIWDLTLKISGGQKFKGFLEGFTSRPLDLDVMHLCHPECRKL
jgi:hypothetical protein